MATVTTDPASRIETLERELRAARSALAENKRYIAYLMRGGAKPFFEPSTSARSLSKRGSA